MKKILPVALVLALILAFMIVPAFADEVPVVYEANFDGENPAFQTVPPAGTYLLALRLADFVYPDCIITLVIDDASGGYVANLPDIPGNSYYSDLRLYITEWAELFVFAIPVSDELLETPLLIESCTLTVYSPAPDQPEAPNTGDPIDAVLGVFSGIGSWIVSSLSQYTGLFYSAETGLTLLGVLCCLPIAIGICFVVLLLIINFFKLRN